MYIQKKIKTHCSEEQSVKQHKFSVELQCAYFLSSVQNLLKKEGKYKSYTVEREDYTYVNNVLKSHWVNNTEMLNINIGYYGVLYVNFPL